MTGELCSLVFAMLFVPAVILVYLNAANSLRMRRVRRQFKALSHETRQEILDRIDQAGRSNCSCQLLVASESDRDPLSPEIALVSHFGGIPYAEPGDVWPELAASNPGPADFLIQVLLDQDFPTPWQGRMISVYQQQDAQQTIRSYPAPVHNRFATMTGGLNPQPMWILKQVHIPRQSGLDAADTSSGGLLDYDPVVLLDSVSGLKAELQPYTRQPADLLAAILAPSHCGYGFELSDVVQLAGHPVWLRETLETVDCPVCKRPMRFLFQFGDLNGTEILGDSGVCYIFGCDEHPTHPVGIVQMS